MAQPRVCRRDPRGSGPETGYRSCAKIGQLTAEQDFSAVPDGKPDRASVNNGQEL
jgi:hypothetical protein